MVAYNEGMSHLKWPQSKHNKVPSMVVDVVAPSEAELIALTTVENTNP